MPVFAFFAAVVTIGDRLGPSLTDSVTLGIIAGLMIGKTIGVLGTTWLVQRVTHARLAEGLSWWDMLGLALLAGTGFTVALLIGELAFGTDSKCHECHTPAKIGVLLGSLLSALLATIVLRIRNHHHRQRHRTGT
ncbi:MAG: Na+/H+ antiporter NhaA [Pseudonocardiaceae bacterium]